MDRNNINLVDYCKKALSKKWFYGWGAIGQKATTQLVDSLVEQYPGMNTRWKQYMLKAVYENNNLCDCYGLVKGFLSTADTGKVKHIGKYDINTGRAYKKAIEKGPLETMPDLPGIILYMPGHVGVYIGDNEFIECAGGGVGMAKGKIENKKITKGSKFTEWFKDVNINYIKEEPPAIEPIKPAIDPVSDDLKPFLPVVQEHKILTVIIDNQEKELEAIKIDGYNYVKLRDIATAMNYITEVLDIPYEKNDGTKATLQVPILTKDDEEESPR